MKLYEQLTITNELRRMGYTPDMIRAHLLKLRDDAVTRRRIPTQRKPKAVKANPIAHGNLQERADKAAVGALRPQVYKNWLEELSNA